MTDNPSGETLVIHVARVCPRNESTVEFAAATANALEHAIAKWCRENWAEARRRWDHLPDEPPSIDALAVEEYFAVVLDGTILERGTVGLDPAGHTDGRSDVELMLDYEALDALIGELLDQRTAVARAVLRRVEGRQTEKPQQPLSGDDERLVKRLLVSIILSEAAAQTTVTLQRETEAASLDRLPPVEEELTTSSNREILELIAGELPGRSFERRIYWRVDQLERILALNDASPVPLTDDERALRESVSVNARALIDARRVPPPQNAGDANRVQVAYLMPVEVVVDLDERRVTRVFGVNEALELDPIEGARAESTLEPVPPGVAGRAVAIAESARGWQPMTFG